MLKTKKISDVINMRVFTDSGDLFGEVEESLISSNKVFGWKIKSTKRSYLNKVLGGAKGVIVPHQLVKSIGDIMIITKADIPAGEDKIQESSE
jgi:sporulation protein YlmC with PRC-barrel domain